MKIYVVSLSIIVLLLSYLVLTDWQRYNDLYRLTLDNAQTINDNNQVFSAEILQLQKRKYFVLKQSFIVIPIPNKEDIQPNVSPNSFVENKVLQSIQY